jgi:peptide/nickel transport system substrate-binding protein
MRRMLSLCPHAFILAAALFLAAVSAAVTAPPAAAQDALVIAQGADIITLDPTQATQIHNLNLFYNIYDALVTWDPKDIGKVVPDLALSWRSIDPLTWQFKLRRDVKFHNGEPFNADAAKFTIDRLITKGVHQVYGGFSTIERVDVVDPYTINVVTSKPDPILVKRFAGYGGQMLPPQYIKQVDWKAFALKPVGTGAYKFVEWIKDDRVVLEANRDYWRGVPKIKKVTWRPIPDNFARVAALGRNEAQLITKVLPDLVPQVEKAGCCRVEHTLTNLVTVYLINAQKGPLANVKLRQALNYAVDKDKIIKELFKGFAIPIGSGIPNTDFGFDPKIKPYPYDPARAKQLMAEAGFPNGVDIEIQSGNGIHLNDRQLTDAVALMLQEVGVRAKVGVLEPAQRGQLLRTSSFPGLLLADPASTTYDTDGVIWRLRGPGGVFSQAWPGAYEGTRFYQLMEEARVTLDAQKRLRNYHEAAQIFHDEAPELFLFQGELIDGVRNEVQYKARGDQRIIVYDISFR